jgi:hypothetical protein
VSVLAKKGRSETFRPFLRFSRAGVRAGVTQKGQE